MSNPRRSRRAAGSRTVDEDTLGQDAASALEENVQAIERSTCSRTRGACRLDRYGRGLLRGLRVVAK